MPPHLRLDEVELSLIIIRVKCSIHSFFRPRGIPVKRNSDQRRPLQRLATPLSRHDAPINPQLLPQEGALLFRVYLLSGTAGLLKATLNNDLRVAARGNDVARVKELLEDGADVDATCPNGMRPLHWAAMTDASAAAQVLIKAGADVEAADTSGWKRTPLHSAARNDARSVAKVLVEAGAYIQAADSSGRRPLHLAAFENSSATAKFLIEAGADVEAVDLCRERPLHWAAWNNAAAAAKVLIEAGAEVNVTNEKAEAPLHIAAERGRAKIVRVLLGAGADPHLCDSSGKTPLELARENGRNAVVEILKEETDCLSTSQAARFDLQKQVENASDSTPSCELVLSSQQSIEEKGPVILPPVKKTARKHQQVALHNKASTFLS